MKVKKKIIALMPNMKGGGAQRVMGIILKNASASGYNVELLLIDENAPIEYKLDDKIVIKYIPGQKGNKFFRRIRLVLFLYRYTRRNKDAVFLSFLTERNLDLLIAAPRDVRVVVSERNDPARSIKNTKLWHNLRNRLYPKAWKVVFQTPDAMKYFNSVNGIDGIVIPNPLSDDLPYYNKDNQSKVIVSVARLSSQKNYPMLMDAFEIVYSKHSDYELHVWGKEYGEKGITDYLKGYAKSLHCGNAIKFRGFSTNVHPHVANAEIFVSSSDYEGMSNSMLEALAIGIPCVCTDCPIGGAKMFIENGQNGLLVPVGDSKAMAEALCRMIEDKALRNRCYTNADKIRRDLDEKKVFSQWRKLFE